MRVPDGVIVAVLLAAQVASADPSPEVTRAFQAGVDAFRLGKHDEARKHLERAKHLDPKLPGPNRFLAAVAQAQGRFADCVTAARLAIELNPTSQELADTRKLHDDCRRSDGRPSYTAELGDKAAIGVTANVSGATVKISGLVYGATPLEPRPIPAGSHELELTKTGYLPVKLAVTALAGIVTDVDAELVVDPGVQGGAEVGTKVVPRATGEVLIAMPSVVGQSEDAAFDNVEVLVDGVRTSLSHRHAQDDRAQVVRGLHLTPGIRVIEVHVPGKDPWRRRVPVAVSEGGAPELQILRPGLVDVAKREHTRTKGLWLTGTGIGFAVVGAVTLAVGTTRDEAVSRQLFYGLGAGSLGLGAAVLVFGALDLVRGQRPDPTAAPPLAVIPVEGGVIAGTGLAF